MKKFTNILELELPEKQEMKVKKECFASDKAVVSLMIKSTTFREKDWILVKNINGNREYIAPIPMGFDIETTTKNEKSYMYIWQLSFGNFVIYGRTWEEWFDVMEQIERHFKLGTTKTETTRNGKTYQNTTKRRILFWIANLGFEFQFFARKLNKYGRFILQNEFSDKRRSPLYVELTFLDRDDSGFIVYDSNRVANNSLESTAKNYCVTQKAVGDLDYDKPRNSQTPLTKEELGYCRNDVVTLNEWARFYLKAYAKTVHFAPMTKTGIIRKAVEQQYEIYSEEDKSVKYKLKRMHPVFAQYVKMIQYLYRGGFTHANIQLANKLLEKVKGFDFTSSYPAVLLQCLYPMSEFKCLFTDETPKTLKHIQKYIDDKQICFYGDFEFENIEATTSHSIEQIYKTHEHRFFNGNDRITAEQCGMLIDNGRIRRANKMTVTLTDVDLEVYKMFYKWEKVTVSNFYIARYGKLPKYITDVVKTFYKKKSLLKKQGKQGDSSYSFAKEMVNSIYGLMVQQIHFDETGFNQQDGWYHETLHINNELEAEDMQKKYKKELFDRREEVKKPTLPQWGIWCTSWARFRLLKFVYKVNEDCVYCDTDSIYLLHEEKHRHLFEEWNNEITELNKELFGDDFEYLGDLGTFDPVALEWKDEEGNKHESFEYSFKTLGAKRYIKFDDNAIETTIAGLKKNALYKKAKKETDGTHEEICKRIVELFNDGMTIAETETFKLMPKYNDEPHSEWITDEFGNTELMNEDSSVTLVNVDFTMNLNATYVQMMNEYRKEHDRFGEII